MLQRIESTITIADSCQSISPGPTPKKRTYTQVFSTPVTCRFVKRTCHDTTPESPLFITSSRVNGPRGRLRYDTRPASVQAQTQTDTVRSFCWTDLEETLSNESWLAESTLQSQASIKACKSNSHYNDLLSHARRHFELLSEAGDFADESTASLARQYILNHHLIRVERLLSTVVPGFESVSMYPLSSHPAAADCVPPTPPGSDTPDMLRDEAEIMKRSPDITSQLLLLREQTVQDEECDELAPAFTNERPNSESLLPWPASGTRDYNLKGLKPNKITSQPPVTRGTRQVLKQAKAATKNATSDVDTEPRRSKRLLQTM